MTPAHRTRKRRASVLLLVLFIMAITAPLMALMLDTHTTYIRCVHNHVQSATALYVAEAGVHDAIGVLLETPTWRTGFADKTFPSGLGHTYTVTLTDAAGGLTITSIATTADGYTKTIQVTVSGF